MHRKPRMLIMAGVLLLAGSTTAAAQDAPVDQPELVAEGRFSSVDMALDRDGHRHIVSSRLPPDEDASDFSDALKRDLSYATDRDGSWSTQILLTGDGKTGLGWTNPSIAVDDDGSVHIAVVHDHVGSTPGQTEGIFYLTDKGRARGDFGPSVKVAPADMADPSLAVVDGVRYLAYHKLSLPSDVPRPAPVFVKTDLSGSWVRHRLDDYGHSPVLEVDPTGRAHIVYQAATADDRHSILRYVQVDPETGEPTKSRRIPATKDVWYSHVLALDPSGLPHVAWETEKDIAWSRRTADGWSDPETLGIRRSDSLSLVVDPTGQPHVIFRGRGGGDLGGGILHSQRGAGEWSGSVIVEDVGWTPLTSAMSDQEVHVAWVSIDEPSGLWSYGPIPGIDAAAMEGHAALEGLLASVPDSDCAPFTEQGRNDPFSYGALAAIACPKPARGVGQLALFRFPDTDSMTEYWDWRVRQIEPAAARRDGACADGRRGQSAWEHGEIACYVSKASKEAKLRWTDERTGTYGVLDASDRNIARLHAVWKAQTSTGADEVE